MTTTATRVEDSRSLLRQESIQFIRPIDLTLTLIEAKPNLKMNVFFSGDNLTSICKPFAVVSDASPSSAGMPIVTDDLGQAKILLPLPGGTYGPGIHEIIVTEANSIEELNQFRGSNMFGSARGTFSGTGLVSVFQPVRTTTTTTELVIDVPSVDPLAQSFFTHSLDSGIFVSSIEIFFQSRDSSIPVRCEIRPLVNGFPGPCDVSHPERISVVPADQVLVSDDGSIPTKFTFDPPVYLSPNGDYCFVLRSNSMEYNVFTSRMGEPSIETGVGIFEQPYVGSLFKSENNITWTAEQFEDIKFRINKCVFDHLNTASLKFDVKAPPVGTLGGKNFITTAGSNIVKFVHSQDHGLQPGDIFKTIVFDSVRNIGIANGIPLSELEDEHVVISCPTTKSLTFAVTTNASSSGTLDTCGSVTHVYVANGGKDYMPSDTVTFSASPNGGTTAQGSLIVSSDGSIQGITITTPGTEYTTDQIIATITSSTGSGAILYPSSEPSFTVWVNKPYTGILPRFNVINYGDTSFTSELETIIGNYEGGNLPVYNKGETIFAFPGFPMPNIGQCSMIVSDPNNTSGTRTTSLNIELSTNNPDVSPVMSIKEPPAIDVYYPLINSQDSAISPTAEDRKETSRSSGSIIDLSIINPGLGYTRDPIISINPPDDPEGIQATASGVASGGLIVDVSITEPGSGYLRDPIVTVTRGPGDTAGAGAIVSATSSTFNSELLPSGGNAKARYISKKLPLQMISSGIRLFAVISSVEGSYVDWYIRTSLSSSSGEDHESKSWNLLNCNVERNRSSSFADFLEYEFKLDDIEPFDTYDLKCILGTDNPLKSPIVRSYRVIAVV